MKTLTFEDKLMLSNYFAACILFTVAPAYSTNNNCVKILVIWFTFSFQDLRKDLLDKQRELSKVHSELEKLQPFKVITSTTFIKILPPDIDK